MSVGGDFPEAMHWTLLTFASDMAVVVRAFSDEAPASAEILVMAAPVPVSSGAASRLMLRLTAADGAVAVYPLDRVSPEAEQSVIRARAGSVVVVEEDAAAANGRRFTYVAAIRPVLP